MYKTSIHDDCLIDTFGNKRSLSTDNESLKKTQRAAGWLLVMRYVCSKKFTITDNIVGRCDGANNNRFMDPVYSRRY